MIGSFNSTHIAAIEVEIMYTHRVVEKKTLEVKATSRVWDLVDEIEKSCLRVEVEGCKWTLDSEKVVVKHDGNAVDNWKVPVVDFSLGLPFSLGKHVCMFVENIEPVLP